MHTAAVVSCARRAGLTGTSCSFKNQSARATYDYLYCDTPAPLFLAIKTPSARKYNFHQSETTCDTNGHVPTKKHEIPPHPKPPRLKKHFFRQKYHIPASCYDKHKRGYLWRAQYAAHTTATHLPAGSTGSEHMPLYPSCVRLPQTSPLSREQ